MVQQRLQHWIEHPEELGTESLYELRQLLVQYPFFQTARILYLKNLYLLRDPSFKDELRKGALFVADLSILFYAIEGDKFVINRHVAEKENVSSETSDRTLDLIDRFLADDKDLSVEKLFPLPVLSFAGRSSRLYFCADGKGGKYRNRFCKSPARTGFNRPLYRTGGP